MSRWDDRHRLAAAVVLLVGVDTAWFDRPDWAPQRLVSESVIAAWTGGAPTASRPRPRPRFDLEASPAEDALEAPEEALEEPLPEETVDGGTGEAPAGETVTAMAVPAPNDGGIAANEDGGIAASEDGGIAAGEDGGIAAGEDGGTAPESLSGVRLFPRSHRKYVPGPPIPFSEGSTWAKLRQKAGSGRVRVLQLGDSEIGGDAVATRMRHALRGRFDDGGPGFVFVARPFPWYRREGFSVSENEDFKVRSMVDGRRAAVNGMAGVAFEALSAGVSATVGVEKLKGSGCVVRFHYARQPGGGRIQLRADDKELGKVETSAEAVAPAAETYTLESCPRRLTVTALSLPAKVYGWDVARSGGGAVWSTIGIVSSSIAKLGAHERPAFFAEAVASLSPDLVVFTYGLNVIHRGPSALIAQEARFLKPLLAALRERSPDTACLVMTPYPLVLVTDGVEGENDAGGPLVDALRPIALEAGCSFMDRESLFGGPGTALEWIRSHPKLLSTDHVHLTEVGARKVGDELGRFLLEKLDAAGGGP